MLKQIKYKAFQKSKNCMYEVLNINLEGVDKNVREVKLSNGKIIRLDQLDDIVLIEFIGLKDAKGIETYEGDIIVRKIRACNDELVDQIGIVRYCEKNVGFVLEIIQCEMLKQGAKTYFFDYPFEIIGNIYERQAICDHYFPMNSEGEILKCEF